MYTFTRSQCYWTKNGPLTAGAWWSAADGSRFPAGPEGGPSGAGLHDNKANLVIKVPPGRRTHMQTVLLIRRVWALDVQMVHRTMMAKGEVNKATR